MCWCKYENINRDLKDNNGNVVVTRKNYDDEFVLQVQELAMNYRKGCSEKPEITRSYYGFKRVKKLEKIIMMRERKQNRKALTAKRRGKNPLTTKNNTKNCKINK